MSWKPKRFWKDATVEACEGGFTVRLDARPVKTPGKNLLVVPTRAMAEAIAAASGHHTISLIAEDTHQDALRLYSAMGFRQIARRPVVKGDWAVDASEWILFTKAVSAN